jgi:hypothetical protein
VPLIPDQDLDPLLGVVEELEAALGQLDPLLERLERFIEERSPRSSVWTISSRRPSASSNFNAAMGDS